MLYFIYLLFNMLFFIIIYNVDVDVDTTLMTFIITKNCNTKYSLNYHLLFCQSEDLLCQMKGISD